MLKSPSEDKKTPFFPPVASLSFSPTVDEKCSICDKLGKSFNQQWIGCIGCSYWICVDCAFDLFPGHDLFAGKIAQKKKNFYKCVVSMSPAYAWQYLCPTCTNDITNRRVLSPMDVQVSPALADPATNVDIDHVSKDEFMSKIASLTSVITDIGSQIKEIKSSLDTKSESYADIAKKNIEMSQTMTRTMKETVKSAVYDIDPNKVLIFSRLPETGSVAKDYSLITKFIDGLVPEGGVTIEERDVRDIVRLGRPRDDLKRLIKVTFTNVRSVRLIMDYHRNHAKDCLIPESAIVLFKQSISEQERLYTRFGIRPDLPKEKRDIIKERAQKVYEWNNEILTEAISEGCKPKVSYSLRGNGDVWKFIGTRRRTKNPQNYRDFCDFAKNVLSWSEGEPTPKEPTTPEYIYVEEWSRDKNWKYNE